jgi:hypothetical protein
VLVLLLFRIVPLSMSTKVNLGNSSLCKGIRTHI